MGKTKLTLIRSQKKGGTKMRSSVHCEARVLSWRIMDERDARFMGAPRSPRDGRGRANRPVMNGAKRTVTREAETRGTTRAVLLESSDGTGPHQRRARSAAHLRMAERGRFCLGGSAWRRTSGRSCNAFLVQS